MSLGGIYVQGTDTGAFGNEARHQVGPPLEMVASQAKHGVILQICAYRTLFRCNMDSHEALADCDSVYLIIICWLECKAT